MKVSEQSHRKKRKGKKIKDKVRKRDTHSHSPVDSLG